MSYRIVMLGAGNVATHLSKALQASGHTILQVYNHQLPKAEQLAKTLNCAATDQLETLDQTADFYLISVKDTAIGEVASRLNLSRGIVAHTSGSIALDVLSGSAPETGVLYPLQTFSAHSQTDFTTIPLCLEGNTSATIKELSCLAASLSKTYQVIDSNQRACLHLAAVFANNFTNHLYQVAHQLLTEHQLSFDLLIPLIQETTQKLSTASPAQNQTGPATRNDQAVIDQHLKRLADHPEYAEIYRLLSESITKAQH